MKRREGKFVAGSSRLSPGRVEAAARAVRGGMSEKPRKVVTIEATPPSPLVRRRRREE